MLEIFSVLCANKKRKLIKIPYVGGLWPLVPPLPTNRGNSSRSALHSIQTAIVRCFA
jgi:hypothetical protein